MTRLNSVLIGILFITAAMTGCQSMPPIAKPTLPSMPTMDSVKEAFSMEKKDEEPNPPVSMAVIWKDGFYEQPGQKTVRGLGGRIFFYDIESNPTVAKGQLVVYGFEDVDNELDKNAADRKFVFPEDKFQSHYSETDLGESYSVWIPWDGADGERKTVSLIPVFKTADGRVIKSGQTLCVLPGKSPTNNRLASTEPKSTRVRSFEGIASRIPDANSPAAQNNSYVAQASGVDGGQPLDQIGTRSPTVSYKNSIRTSTISVPRSLANRMSQLPAPKPQKPRERKESTNHGAKIVKRIAEMKAELRARDASSDENTPSHPGGKFPTNRPVFGTPGSFN